MNCSWHPPNPNRSRQLSRRLRIALLVSSAWLLGGAAAWAQSLKIATLVPEGSMWDKAIRRMGSEWKDSTGGRVSLVLYPNGVAGDEAETFKKMRIGQLHGAFASASGLGAIDSAFNLFGIPMFLRSDEELQRILTELGPLFERRLRERGYVLLHWGHAGWLRVFSTAPVQRYEDFERLKFFVWGQGNKLSDWFEARGFRSVILPVTEVATGLQTGLVESLPVTPLAALSFQWFRSAPYMFDYRFAPLVGATVLTEKAWARVAEEDRAKLLEAGGRAGETLFRDVPGQEEGALAEMQKRGLTLTRSTSDDDLKKWEELAAYLEECYRKDSVPEEVFAEVARVLREFRAGDPGGGR